MPKHKKKSKKVNFKLGFFIAPIIFAAVAIFVLSVAYAAVDPSKNYLYGTSYSDCSANDFQIAPDTVTQNNIHCLRFSSDKSTYATGPTTGANNQYCGRSPFSAEGGIKYDSKLYGILCAYFKPKTTVIQKGVLDISSAPANVAADCNSAKLTKGNCGIVALLIDLINALSAIVGVVIVIMIAVAGIQFSASRDDPQAINAARNRILNAILALVFYLFIFAFLQWIVPGGIFHAK